MNQVHDDDRSFLVPNIVRIAMHMRFKCVNPKCHHERIRNGYPMMIPMIKNKNGDWGREYTRPWLNIKKTKKNTEVKEMI